MLSLELRKEIEALSQNPPSMTPGEVQRGLRSLAKAILAITGDRSGQGTAAPVGEPGQLDVM